MCPVSLMMSRLSHRNSGMFLEDRFLKLILNNTLSNYHMVQKQLLNLVNLMCQYSVGSTIFLDSSLTVHLTLIDILDV